MEPCRGRVDETDCREQIAQHMSSITVSDFHFLPFELAIVAGGQADSLKPHAV